MKTILSLALAALAVLHLPAEEPADSSRTENLDEVVVEASLQQTGAQKSVYLPTARQKKASISGTDLLERIGIPQLQVSDGSVTTAAGRPVAVFIDYLPASQNDLNAMRMSDVRKVEYYQYPSDPRLQGNAYVVNFVMAKYEYGGYVKGYAQGYGISLWTGQLLGNVRMQYKKMTYDLMGYGYAYNTDHDGYLLSETYRLPQPDGNIKEFNRFSDVSSSKYDNRQYLTAFKATYNSEKIQASSQVNANFKNTPHSDSHGEVTYRPADFTASAYSSMLDSRTRSLAYNGYYFFALPKGNSLTFTPSYVYSHSEQNTSYTEGTFAPILNGASDNTNSLFATLKFKHDFGKYGSLLGRVRGDYEYSRTRYTGTANSLDKAKTSRIGIGATYDVTVGDFYGLAGFGWDWDRVQFGDRIDKPSSPWIDLSLQYGIRDKHSIETDFHYSTWSPSSSYMSENVIKSTPLLSYTGNPHLVPFKSYTINLNYTWMPSNNYSLSAYVWSWFVGDRYVYNYEATSEGIIRTISQPMGGYAQGNYGISGTARFLDRSLVFSGRVGQTLGHNGRPYNFNRGHINWYVRAMYYTGNWNFSLTYISDTESPAGSMNGNWQREKDYWYATVGWANDHWNVKAYIMNLTRWNWRGDYQRMRSPYYDTDRITISGTDRALMQVAVTYTFGFGKKVSDSGEPSTSTSVSSGILR